MIQIKSIKERIVLFPGEVEKWVLNKHDFIFLKTTGKVEVSFNRVKKVLKNNVYGIIQYSSGQFVIRNLESNAIHIYGIHFMSDVQWATQKSIITTFDPIPFKSVIEFGDLNDISLKRIKHTLELFQREDTLVKEKKMDTRLIVVNRYIRKNYSYNITLQDLADLAGVHPTYLSNMYSKVFNVSPIYYLNQLRIRRAKELLKHSNLTIKEVATSVGYQSLSQFSSIFKRFLSIPPSQYRLNLFEEYLVES